MTAIPATRVSESEHWLRTHRRVTIAWIALYLGAASLVVSGVVHLHEYFANEYRSIPNIGRLFVLNFVAAVVVAAGLIAPFGLIAPIRRYADAIRAALAVAGIGVAVLSLAALFISETIGLLGFTEPGYREAVVVAMASEIAAVVFLVVYLVASGAGLRTMRQKPQ